MLDEKFLEHKLEGVNLKRPPLRLNLFGISELNRTQTQILRKKPYLRTNLSFNKLITDLLSNSGLRTSTYSLATKPLNQSIWKVFLKDNFSGYNYHMGYFFNLRGINDAQDCNVGIMLGSALPSDAVEVAMALEFIQPPYQIQTELENNFWVWEGSKGHGSYREDHTNH